MKIASTLGLAAGLAAASVSSAQTILSPEVHADRSVTFRYRAPAAKEVVLRCEALPKAQPMQKDAEGVWSFKTDPVAPDFYVYSYMVDGQRVLDPSNPLIKYNLFGTENQVHVPGTPELPWEIDSVPQGVLHRHHYRSAVIGDERDVWVYTPPGYDASAAKNYPVLYLLHGYSDAEDTWVTVGRANVILDNLIAKGLVRPMLVVMPRGYGNKAVVEGGWTAVRGPAGQGAWLDSNQKYVESLRTEIIPFVEKHYRVDAKRDARAVAGLSMGGTQSILSALGSPDTFAWVGAFSSGGLPQDYAKRFSSADEKLNERMRLIWIACGTEDGLINANRQFSAWLKERGVKHTWVETPGRHSFLVWRRYLVDFTPLLFRPAN